MTLEYLKYSTEKLQIFLDKIEDKENFNFNSEKIQEELGNTVIKGKSTLTILLLIKISPMVLATLSI